MAILRLVAPKLEVRRDVPWREREQGQETINSATRPEGWHSSAGLAGTRSKV